MIGAKWEEEGTIFGQSSPRKIISNFYEIHEFAHNYLYCLSLLSLGGLFPLYVYNAQNIPFISLLGRLKGRKSIMTE
jgi:hypothetical protein